MADVLVAGGSGPVPDPIAVLDAALDALAEIESADLDDAEVDARLMALVRARHRLDARIAETTGDWDGRRCWATDGSKSAAARLSRDGGCSPAEARRIVRRARKIRAMPATADEWSAGQIGTDLVDRLAAARVERRAGLFDRDERHLLAQTDGLLFADAEKVLRYWAQHADAELGHDGTPPPPPTGLTHATTIDGIVTGTFTLDPIGGAEVVEAIRRIERDIRVADKQAGVVRSYAERKAAALVEMAKRALAAPADARRPEPLIVILAGDESLARVCELATGTVIHPGTVVPHLGAADVQTIVFDDADHPIRTSPQRSFRGALRRAIQARDRRCQHASGCDEPITRCDVDHVVPHADGGPTDIDNGRLLCTTHNRHADLDDRRPPPGAASRPTPPPEPPVDLTCTGGDTIWRVRIHGHRGPDRWRPGIFAWHEVRDD